MVALPSAGCRSPHLALLAWPGVDACGHPGTQATLGRETEI